jgi:hypothetical protein
MDVLQEILKWSEERPMWQRDALRRLVVQGSIQEKDYDDLLAICKSIHGLAPSPLILPLSSGHIPIKSTISKPVRLNALTHHDGVNALAQNQTVTFGSGLTVVYGQNAAGKSGYTRVLKRACRARGSEEVLSNVLLDTIPPKPSVSLTYEVEAVQQTWNWTEMKDANSELTNVSVFDRHCATVYLDEKTDVAFRPFGLDLFDKISAACEKLKAILERERSQLTIKEFETSVPKFTKAFKLIENITSLTNLEEIKTFATLNDEELTRQIFLKKQVLDLKSEDTEKTKKALSLYSDRVRQFRVKLEGFLESLKQEHITTLTKLQSDIAKKYASAKEIKVLMDKYDTLKGINSPEWEGMWKSTSAFSKIVFPDKKFPFAEAGAQCLLCQQNLDELSSERLTAFGDFMESNVQKDLNDLKQLLDDEIETLQRLRTQNLANADVLAEIQIDNPEVVNSLKKVISTTEEAIDQMITSLREGTVIESKGEQEPASGLEVIEQSLQERLRTLTQQLSKDAQQKLEQELKELDAREILQKEIGSISTEIEKKKRYAAYNLCLEDVSTANITRKSTEITKTTVTEHLSKSFREELKKIGFTHPEIELQASGGSRGSLYHKLVIKQATHARLQNVVSEGEARALSIAAFFSELSTSTNSSAILFDDPVSSLDHVWRDRVAARLVEEAKIRQVVVFTHDVVFLVTLQRLAGERNVTCLDQYIHKEYQGAGVCSPDLPWVAMKIKGRMGVLNRLWQEADKIERTVSKDEYDKKAIAIYGYLREAWERALEEVLFNGIIERYRPGIQTQQIKNLADITETDCTTVFEAMTKCSRWLPGHDNAPAENSPVPDSKELKADIVTLETWIGAIQARRKSK